MIKVFDLLLWIIVTLWTIYVAYLMQIIIWDCTFLLSRSPHKALTLILVLLYRDLPYHCTIRSDPSTPCFCTITS